MQLLVSVLFFFIGLLLAHSAFAVADSLSFAIQALGSMLMFSLAYFTFGA